MSDIIVVTGRREQQSDGSFVMTFSVGTGVPPGVRFYEPRQVPEDGSQPVPIVEVSVATEKTNPETDQADLNEAAKKVAEAVARIITELNKAPLASVTILGRVISAGTLRNEILTTDFIVSDRLNFNNKGVGSAEYGADGRNTDIINYQAIIGGGPNPGYYGDPSKPDNSGMHVLILHEMGHMNAAGYSFFDRSTEVYNNDSTISSSETFHDSDYGVNNEAFAEAVAQAMANAIGLNLYGETTGSFDAPVEPEQIYQQNNGEPYPS